VDLRESYSRDLRIFDRWYKWVWLALLAAALLVYSQTGGNYAAYMLNLIFINIIVAVGLNILTGYAGLISLGHAAFMAIGAYFSTIFTVKFSYPFYLVLPMSGAVAGFIGFVVGLPSLRLTGIYLALATMAFGFITDEIIIQWHSITGGAEGLQALPATVFGFVFDSYPKYFFITFVSLGLVLFSAKNLLRGPFGRALSAIRDSETAAETMGVNLGWYKALAFSLSATYTGLAGSLYAHLVLFISTDNFTLLHSISFIVMIVVGGLGSIAGAVMGASFITILPEIIAFSKDWLPAAVRNAAGLQAAVYGIILMLFVILQPSGFFGFWLRVKIWLKTFPL
jgi:branched-chain amino acid transport system permease protein